MMESYNKKREMKNKDDHVLIELTTIRLDNEERNDRRQVKGISVGVQADLTATTLDDQQTNDRRQVKSKDIRIQDEQPAIMFDDQLTNDQGYVLNKDAEITSDSSHKFHILPHLISNGEEILDQSHVKIVMEDSRNASEHSITKKARVVEPTTVETNLTTTNIINDIRAHLDPIMGYAREPLLPLSKACCPLTNILHNLSFYVHMALDETPEQPPDGLTIDESAAIRLYTIEWEKPHRSLYSMLNHTLKYDDHDYLRPYFKYMKLFLTALAKLPCVPPLTVWRGVHKDFSAEFPPGTPVTWWAFSSCTTQLPVLENNMYLGNTGNRTLFSVEAINGRTIRAHSHFVTEDEILLLPGTHMIVQSQFSPAPDLHIIHLKQIRPEQVLLEPPFEGN
jgi:hypothetical protein